MKMAEYEVTLTRTQTATVTIEADSAGEAVDKVAMRGSNNNPGSLFHKRWTTRGLWFRVKVGKDG